MKKKFISLQEILDFYERKRIIKQTIEASGIYGWYDYYGTKLPVYIKRNK
jgi:hypothetical protein